MLDEIKVFSATMLRDRCQLGERVTRWIQEHRSAIEIVDKTVHQSSDDKFHCLTITIFYRFR